MPFLPIAPPRPLFAKGCGLSTLWCGWGGIIDILDDTLWCVLYLAGHGSNPNEVIDAKTNWDYYNSIADADCGLNRLHWFGKNEDGDPLSGVIEFPHGTTMKQAWDLVGEACDEDGAVYPALNIDHPHMDEITWDAALGGWRWDI